MTAQVSAVATTRQGGAISALDDWNQQRVDFVLKHYCGGAPEAIADAFIHISRKRRLAPEEKQIYIVKRGEDWKIETGIDGYRLIAERTGVYAGADRPLFEMSDDPKVKHPLVAVVTVWKIVAGHRCPFTAEARWEEYCPPTDKQAFMWAAKPFLMLAKTAEALALRKAFPADLSGVYVDAELDQAGAPAGGFVDVDGRTVDPATGEIVGTKTTEWERENKAIHAAAADKFPGEADKHVAVHDLVCARFELASINDATPAQLRIVRAVIQKWDAAWSQKGLEWVRTIEGATDESMLTEIRDILREEKIKDGFLKNAFDRRWETVTGKPLEIAA